MKVISSKMNHQSGFTLIEVMVALAILAVVAVAANQASTGYIRSVDGMKTRTLAHFVAQNAGAKLIIDEAWIGSSKQEEVTEQGRTWQVVYTPNAMPQMVSQQLQYVNINVAEVIQGLDGGERKTGTGSDITIMIRKPD